MQASGERNNGTDELELDHRGRRLRLHLPNRETDHVQRGIATRRRFYEGDMLGHMEAMLRPGELVVDVGAYIGSHVVYLAGGCDARVVAFEPNPAAFSVLQRNVELNGLGERVQSRSCALGRERGRGTLVEPPEDNLGSAAVVADEAGEVEVLPLDAVELPAPPRIVKIDVEGMEGAVLEGAADTIRRHRPLVYVEVSTKAALAGVLDRMRGWGYAATSQFNATPTVLMVPGGDVLEVLNAQLAFARHALHTDLAAHGERQKRQLERQREQRARLDEIAERVAQWSGDERRWRHEEGRRLLETAAEQGVRLEALQARVEQGASATAEAMAALERKVLGLYERIAVADDRISERLARAVRSTERVSAEQAALSDESRRGSKELRRAVQRQERRLGRIEAELFSLKQRLASEAAPATDGSAPARATGAGRKPASGGAPTMRSWLSAPARKYRKLRADPERFFDDARSPLVRSVGRAYLSVRGRS